MRVQNASPNSRKSPHTIENPWEPAFNNPTKTIIPLEPRILLMFFDNFDIFRLDYLRSNVKTSWCVDDDISKFQRFQALLFSLSNKK